MRKYIVLHSIDDCDFNQPIIIYIDMISYITPRVEDKKKVNGTIIYLNGWSIAVQESIGDVMNKIKIKERE